jgi:hypothetical protein
MIADLFSYERWRAVEGFGVTVEPQAAARRARHFVT